ncbi:MAG: HAD family hydrolase [Acholeplasmataceae bacterium]
MKAILFDMDGTVLNTIDDIHASVNHALKRHHYPIKTVDEIKRGVGNGAYHLIENVVPEDLSQKEIQSVFDIYQTYYDTHNQVYTKPYPGIINCLRVLKTKGYKLGVVSNKYDYLVKALNEEMFDSLFDVAIGEIKGIPIKPAPDMLYQALKVLNISINEAIFIGDSDTDLQTAKNAKMKAIAVTWGYRDKKTLKTYEPEALVDTVDELDKTIERISTL